jgi:hypothetical protein
MDNDETKSMDLDNSTEYDEAFLDFMIEEDEQMEENVKS